MQGFLRKNFNSAAKAVSWEEVNSLYDSPKEDSILTQGLKLVPGTCWLKVGTMLLLRDCRAIQKMGRLCPPPPKVLKRQCKGRGNNGCGQFIATSHLIGNPCANYLKTVDPFVHLLFLMLLLVRDI